MAPPPLESLARLRGVRFAVRPSVSRNQYSEHVFLLVLLNVQKPRRDDAGRKVVKITAYITIRCDLTMFNYSLRVALVGTQMRIKAEDSSSESGAVK